MKIKKICLFLAMLFCLMACASQELSPEKTGDLFTGYLLARDFNKAVDYLYYENADERQEFLEFSQDEAFDFTFSKIKSIRTSACGEVKLKPNFYELECTANIEYKDGEKMTDKIILRRSTKAGAKWGVSM